jgi:hypothetical protein
LPPWRRVTSCPRRDHDRDPTLNQIGRKAWQSIKLPLRPTRFDRNVLVLDVTSLFETLPKRGQETPRTHLAILR